MSAHAPGARPATRLDWSQRRFLLVLALPAFGLSLAYTMTTTYVPVLLVAVSGPTVTGAMVGGEGLLAMFVPLLIGGWSDRANVRLPFLLAGAGLAVVALVLLPIRPDSLTWVGVCLGLFFIAYFSYSVPYFALYPDLVPRYMMGRAQGVQGTFRAAALLLALSLGGLFLTVWQPLPFLIGGSAIAIVTTGLIVVVNRRSEPAETPHVPERRSLLASFRLLRRDPRIRRWMFANTCWEAAIGSLRIFVVLYFTIGLGLSLTTSSAALALVGVGALLAAPVAGKLADRYGPRPVIQLAIWVFVAGLLPTQFTSSSLYIIAIVPVAFAAVVLVTLPYTLLVELLPQDRDHGMGAGVFQLSRGFGIVLGPLCAGVTIDLLSEGPLTYGSTSGYSAIFGVSAVFLIISTLFVKRSDSQATRHDSGDARL